MHQSEGDPSRLGSGRDAVFIDVEGVACVRLIVDSDIARIDERAQRQRISVRNLPLGGSGGRSSYEEADAGAVGRAAAAVAGTAPKSVQAAAANRHGSGDSPEVACERACERAVVQPFIDA